MVKFHHSGVSSGPENRTSHSSNPSSCCAPQGKQGIRSKGHTKAGTVSHPWEKRPLPMLVPVTGTGRTCTNLTLLCTCASVRILSGVEGSRWIIRIVHRLHSVNTDEAPGMSPRSLRKGQSYLARHFIFLQLGEARLSHGYQKVIREESQAPPTQV